MCAKLQHTYVYINMGHIERTHTYVYINTGQVQRMHTYVYINTGQVERMHIYVYIHTGQVERIIESASKHFPSKTEAVDLVSNNNNEFTKLTLRN